MFLGSRAWGDRLSRRLAEEPAREAVPMLCQRAWRPRLEDVVQAVVQAFGVDGAEVLVRRRDGNGARLAASYVARKVTDEAVGAMGRCFGDVRVAAISLTVACVEKRRGADQRWDRRRARRLDPLRVKAGAAKEEVKC